MVLEGRNLGRDALMCRIAEEPCALYVAIVCKTRADSASAHASHSLLFAFRFHKIAASGSANANANALLFLMCMIHERVSQTVRQS